MIETECTWWGHWHSHMYRIRPLRFRVDPTALCLPYPYLQMGVKTLQDLKKESEGLTSGYDGVLDELNHAVDKTGIYNTVLEEFFYPNL